MMRIHTRALAISCGIVFGGVVFLLTLLSMFFSYGDLFFSILISLYPGFSVSIVGAFLGAVYTFGVVFVLTSIIGYIYNQLFVRI